MAKKTLIIGPSICEFGWNLMAYNPHCRAIAQDYDHVIVCCPPGEEYIWPFANEFFPVKKPDRADRWLIKNGRTIKIPKILTAKFPLADTIVPNKKTCTSKVRRYACFNNRPPVGRKIVIHARSSTKYNQENRNWPIKKFEKIVSEFPDYTFYSIGTQAYHIKGTEDMRNWKLGSLCSLLSEANLIIGPSSGPMHLASLCKTPHIVWTYKKKEKAIRGTNRARYEKLWNPFNTRVCVIDEYGWNPPVKEVVRKMREFLPNPTNIMNERNIF